MNEDELLEAAQHSIPAVLAVAALWKYLEEHDSPIAAEIVGQSLDAVMEVSNALIDQLEALK